MALADKRMNIMVRCRATPAGNILCNFQERDNPIMTIELIAQKNSHSRPIWLLREDRVEASSLPAHAKAWLAAQNYRAKAGAMVLIPTEEGNIAGAVLGLGKDENPFTGGVLAKTLPEGSWHFADMPQEPFLTTLGIAMGGYHFDRYLSEKEQKKIEIAVPGHTDMAELKRQVETIALVRDLINTPANDMGPEALEKVVATVAQAYNASLEVTKGEELLHKNLPLIHAVGRAGATAPRLIDMQWGPQDAPKVTLVGKGVCFDTGGLDIKTASGMLLMKKDMGGAANVLGLARLVMDAKLPVRLRLLVPAVENAISGNAFRPGDILPSHKGLSVEIGNTDAEGRLVLADALAVGDEDAPDVMLDMATLTGAARTALGPDLPPFYCRDDDFASRIAGQAVKIFDPLWRMPLWQPYMKNLSSRIADINNITSDAFAGSVTAALFLSRFTEKAKLWAHFDIYGWTPAAKPGFPVGGEAQGIRALYAVLKEKFGK